MLGRGHNQSLPFPVRPKKSASAMSALLPVLRAIRNPSQPLRQGRQGSVFVQLRGWRRKTEDRLLVDDRLHNAPGKWTFRFAMGLRYAIIVVLLGTWFALFEVHNIASAMTDADKKACADWVASKQKKS
jgi:hypothetical protein